jgi:hypothetical protein
MGKVIPNPSNDEIKQALDRSNILYNSIVENIVRHSVYKLDKQFSKHIDSMIDSLVQAQLYLEDYELESQGSKDKG